jgi:hypothetical protein
MATWALYYAIGANEETAPVVLETLSDGSSAWFTPDGEPFYMAPPWVSNMIVNPSIERPSWGHDDPVPDKGPVPDSVSMVQARKALYLSGITAEAVDAAIDMMEDPQRTLAHIEWEYANTVERFSSLVFAMGQLLGLTGEQVDDLFRLAGSL